MNGHCDQMSSPESPFHQLSCDATLAALSSRPGGLTQGEVDERLARWGPNRLPELQKKTFWKVFLAQFRSPFIYLLLAAGVVSVALGHRADAIFIFAVLLINAAVGSFQEWRAEMRSRALRALIEVTTAVRREGRLTRIRAEGLVPGDIVLMESGERVAADMRVLEARNLLVDESLLTGESSAVQKLAEADLAADAPLGDRLTMLHAGSTVQTGRGLAVVTATAERTEVGRLQRALEGPQPDPPLVRRMARFTRQIAVGVLVVIAVISALEFARGVAAGEIFLLAVALAVSAIPEGLPVSMTVALSIAMHRMSQRNVVVRNLPAVEGLGACTLIATDKTGTLTINSLTVARLWLPGHGEVEPADAAGRGLLVAAARASEPPARGESGPSGDAVDLAFFDAAVQQGWNPDEDSDGSGPALVGRVPYEPEKRFAAAFHGDGGTVDASVKGAPETVMALCAGVDEQAREAAERFSENGYRVIALATGPTRQPDESGLVALRLLGLAGLIDPLRPEAHDAVLAAQQAGVRVVMVTGDHPLTALAIARELGLANRRDEVVTGAELAALEPAGLDERVERGRVFARTEPLQKLTIVESLRRRGHLIAVTGDGINDAPALHAADIGVAMGKGGTDVARAAADLILTDDNFASIVAGIEEGRIAYANLRKVILLLISTGAAEILLMLLSTLSGLPPPLTPVQLLWLNLITNGVQDVALAFEKGETDVLRRTPREAHPPVFDRRMIEQVLLSGATIGLIAFTFYYLAMTAGTIHAAAQGTVLWLLVWCENAHVFNSRSETRSALRIPLRSNPLLVGAVVFTQLLQIVVLAVPPLRELLSLQDMTVAEGLRLSGLSLVVLVVMEIYKWSRRRPPGA